MSNMESTRAAIQQMRRDLATLLQLIDDNKVAAAQTLTTAMDASWDSNLLTPIQALNPSTDNTTIALT